MTADIEGTDDEYIVGAKAGFAILNKKTGDLKYIRKFWDDPAKEERFEICLYEKAMAPMLIFLICIG